MKRLVVGVSLMVALLLSVVVSPRASAHIIGGTCASLVEHNNLAVSAVQGLYKNGVEVARQRTYMDMEADATTGGICKIRARTTVWPDSGHSYSGSQVVEACAVANTFNAPPADCIDSGGYQYELSGTYLDQTCPGTNYPNGCTTTGGWGDANGADSSFDCASQNLMWAVTGVGSTADPDRPRQTVTYCMP